MFDIRTYRKAHTVAEAVALLTADPAARPLAGGTDILVRLRELHAGYDNLVDIHDLPELKGISILADQTLRLGAGVSFSDILHSEPVQRCAPLLAEAAASVAGPQIRSMGTLGGNICNGAVSADMVPPLLVLDAELRIAGPSGTDSEPVTLRSVPVRDFHSGPGAVALHRGEVLLYVDIPSVSWQGLGTYYVKYAMREAMDIATINCACGLRVQEGLCTDVRIAFGVAAPTPVRCPHAEAAVLGKPPTQATWQAASHAVTHDVRPRDSWRAAADFRLHIIRTLLQRVLAEASGRVKA